MSIYFYKIVVAFVVNIVIPCNPARYVYVDGTQYVYIMRIKHKRLHGMC